MATSFAIGFSERTCFPAANACSKSGLTLGVEGHGTATAAHLANDIGLRRNWQHDYNCMNILALEQCIQVAI